MATTTTTTGAHILVFPYPAQGHILALLDLTHQLALHNLTITILVTPKNLPILTPLLSIHPSIQTLVLPFPPHPSIPEGVEHVRYIGNHGNVSIISALSKLHNPIIQWFKSHHNPPVAILSDFFLGWTSPLARELGVPRIAFFGTGAFLACVLHYCWRNFERVRSLEDVVEFPDLPGSPLFKEEHLPSVFRLYRESDPDWAIVRDSLIENTSSWSCIVNSFESLEGQYLDYLRKTMGHGRVYGVGPLGFTAGTNLMDRGNPDPEAGCDVLTWLDGCPDGSVVYVCFGSQKLMKRDQMEALAFGLERSGIRFVWVVKPGTTQEMEDGYGFVPEGFEERVGDRGVLVKGWAPQVLILNHRAVGGFLSHCGWNSVMEGIAAGVMILAWPMEADQFVDARLLVEDMQAAVQVCEGANAVPDSNQLAHILAESLSGDIPQKARAKELTDKAMAAVKEEGSSFRDLHGLLKELDLLQAKKSRLILRDRKLQLV